MRLANRSVAVDVLPEHGMTISRIARTSGGPNILWERPAHNAVAPRSRDLGPAGEPSIATLHDLLIGGWFEMSPQAGLPGVLDGRETMLHGEASRLPWQVAGTGETWIEATLSTVAEPLELSRRIELDGPAVRVSSTIDNRGEHPVSITHGEHPCFARGVFAGGRLSLQAETATVLPPLDPPSARLVAGEFRWPFAPHRDGGVADLSAIPSAADRSHDHVSIRLADPRVELRTPTGLRVTLEVDLTCHPHLLRWTNYAAPGKPGLGEWDVFALEPMSAPGTAIGDAVRAGAVTRLAAGDRAAYKFVVSLEGEARAGQDPPRGAS